MSAPKESPLRRHTRIDDESLAIHRRYKEIGDSLGTHEAQRWYSGLCAACGKRCTEHIGDEGKCPFAPTVWKEIGT